MAIEKTLSIIKPDATEKNVIGKILSRFEDAGLKIVACRMTQMSKEEAGKFYEVHKERPFYQELVDYMTSGKILISVLEGENAVVRYRDVMGATNPENAAEGTIRKDFAESIEANSVHGSDSLENAQNEIKFFFSDIEIVG